MNCFNVYDVHENKNTFNFGGYEITVDGENGRASFPGRWDPAEARAHYAQGIPWFKPLKSCRTYIVNIDGKYYPFACDTFMTTFYAIGPDRQEGKNNVHYTAFCPGQMIQPDPIHARNLDIMQVSCPHDYKTAVNIARSAGNYSGQLCN